MKSILIYQKIFFFGKRSIFEKVNFHFNQIKTKLIKLNFSRKTKKSLKRKRLKP